MLLDYLITLLNKNLANNLKEDFLLYNLINLDALKDPNIIIDNKEEDNIREYNKDIILKLQI